MGLFWGGEGASHGFRSSAMWHCLLGVVSGVLKGKYFVLHNLSPAQEVSLLWNPNVHYLIDISSLNECPLVCETRSFCTVFLDIMYYSV